MGNFHIIPFFSFFQSRGSGMLTFYHHATYVDFRMNDLIYSVHGYYTALL